MDVREKLVELLDNFHRDLSHFAGNEKLFIVDDNVEQAEYLIAHGVKVQEWISVKDRLPERDDMVIAFYPTMRGTSGEMQIHKAWAMSETCTHWMPLPPAPKGE